MNPPERPKVGSCGIVVKGVEWKLVDAVGDQVPEAILKQRSSKQCYVGWNMSDVKSAVGSMSVKGPVLD